MANADFSHTRNDLSTQWLDATLRQAGAIGRSKVASVTVTPIEGGSGGSVFRVSLSYDTHESSAPVSLIAKLPPRKGTDAHRIMTDIGMPVTEAKFYRELANHVDARTPQCYFSAYDIENRTGAVLIEDLGRMRLGRPGVSLDDARNALRSLARLHASMWNNPMLQQKAWLDWRDRVKPYARCIRAWLDSLDQRFPCVLADRAAAIIESALQDLPSAISRLSRPPVTLVHGDPWINNFAFDDKSRDSAVLFDWQLAARMRPGFDIACFLDIVPEYRTFDNDDAWIEETDCLARNYHSALTEFGVSDYSLDDLLSDRNLARAYTVTAGLWSQMTLQDLIGPEFVRNVREWSERLVERTDALGRTGSGE